MKRILLTMVVFGTLIVVHYKFLGSDSPWSVPGVIAVMVITGIVGLRPDKKSVESLSTEKVSNDDGFYGSDNPSEKQNKRELHREADGPNYDSAEWYH